MKLIVITKEWFFPEEANWINQLMNECVEAEEMGTTKFPGMTYEQGLKDAIEWLCGDSNCYPLDD